MKKRVVKVPFIIAVLTTDNREGFYTGNGFDTTLSKAKRYVNKGIATIQAKKFVGLEGVKKVVVIKPYRGVTIVSQAIRAEPALTKSKSKSKSKSKNNPVKILTWYKRLVFIIIKRAYDLKSVRLNKDGMITGTSVSGHKVTLFHWDDLSTTQTEKYPFKIILSHRGRVIGSEMLSDAMQKKLSNLQHKNPIAGSKKRRVSKARALFEDFTGHPANQYEVVEIPEYDTGLNVGNCVGIMYETIRDGKKEKYLHEFKKASQPKLCVSHDGQQIFLIGGSYLFKDSGINDT